MTETLRPNMDLCNIIALIMEIIVVNIKFYIACFQAVLWIFLPKEESNVRGQVVLITGTGHGIGKQLALKYAALGAKVLCWDINEKNNQETVNEIQAIGGLAHGYVCNVTKRADVTELAEKMKKEHGFVHIIVNNAGIMPCRPLLKTTESEIRNMYDINVVAHLWIIQAFLPDMIEKNCGHIVGISSCAGLFGQPNLVAYSGTKFAVRGILEALAEELHKKYPQNKIQMTIIYPYMVDTGLCKKPHFRFPKIMKLVTTQDAADAIISAQRKGLEEASVPKAYLYLNKIARLLPKNAWHVINDFLDAGVDSDL